MSDLDYLELLEYHDAAMASRFTNGELYLAAKTYQAIDIISAKNEYRKRRADKKPLKDLVPYVDKNNDYATTYIILKYMPDENFEQFAIFCINKMYEFEFDNQPSVNVADANDGRDILLKDRVKTVYEIFAQVDLLKHTNNVVREFEVFMQSKTIHIDKSNIAILALSCLFHDYGKSIKLAKKYNLYNEGMTTGKYKHEILSAKYIDRFAREFNNCIMLQLPAKKIIIEAACKVVASHHSTNWGVCDKITNYLIEIDSKAREEELILLKEEKKA